MSVESFGGLLNDMNSSVGSTHASTHLPHIEALHVEANFLTSPPPRSHAVQFYDDERFLFQTVAHFLRAGLDAGEPALVVATPAHTEGILRALGEHTTRDALRTGLLCLVDARALLAQFMVGGIPNPDLFKDALSRQLSRMLWGEPQGVGIRAFGEMVDLLWRDGNPNAAVRLEELWTEAGRGYPFALLCAYMMGNFYKEGHSEPLRQVCRTHSHVLPAESFSQLPDAQARLQQVIVLEQRARLLESEVACRKEIESALRKALEDRCRVELELRASLRREQEARVQAQANDSFQEVFLGILGHDLRNPLNTILTTSRLMTLRRELAEESQKRLDRIVASGVRMQHMIEQILDMARERLALGIFVTPGNEQDLVPLVSRVVDDVRKAHPEHTIDLETNGPCRATVDGARFEQVVVNLIGNAATHGTPKRPITVSIMEKGDLVSFYVMNHGAAIAQDLLPFLFDPFRRERKAEGRSAGLGLGLYISERIIRGHGGTLEAQSSEAHGTRFEATFPRCR
jgi:signal transduction histidine kinase